MIISELHTNEILQCLFLTDKNFYLDPRDWSSFFLSYIAYITVLSRSVFCPTLCDPMDCSLPGFSVHGDPPGKNTGVVAMPCSRGSSQPRDQTQVSRIAGRFFTIWATREAPRYIANAYLDVVVLLFTYLWFLALWMATPSIWSSSPEILIIFGLFLLPLILSDTEVIALKPLGLFICFTVNTFSCFLKTENIVQNPFTDLCLNFLILIFHNIDLWASSNNDDYSFCRLVVICVPWYLWF